MNKMIKRPILVAARSDFPLNEEYFVYISSLVRGDPSSGAINNPLRSILIDDVNDLNSIPL